MIWVMTTRGIEELKNVGVEFSVLSYRPEETGAEYAARALGLPPREVIKSLVFQEDSGGFVFALIDGAGRVSGKKLARACGCKRVLPASPHDAERVTGYQVGGISPLGAKRALPVFLDAETAKNDTVVINAGARGTLVRLATADLIRITNATVADIRKE